MSLAIALAEMGTRLAVFSNRRRNSQPSETISLTGHAAAMEEITSWPEFAATPLISLDVFAKPCRIQRLWYKDESSRLGLGSFKSLGGAYAVFRILQREASRRTGREPTSKELRDGSLGKITRDITVTTATDGNHGRSVAWGARLFNCQSVIYIPKSCSSGRESAIASYGARLVRTDSGYDETVRLCARDAARDGRSIVSDTSWPGYVDVPREIMHGYTVMVEEVLRQLPANEPLTHVFVQGGVGGLAAAVCAHLSNRLGAAMPSVIIVEPEGAACLFASAQAGKATSLAATNTIMAGLDCGEVSPLAWEILRDKASAFVTVSDAVVAPCVRLLAFPPPGIPPIVAGESAVAGFAVLLLASHDTNLRSKLGLTEESRVLVIGTEGNTDDQVYRSLLAGKPKHEADSSPA